MKILILARALLSAAVLLSLGTTPSLAAGKLSVVTTTTYYAELARFVGGDFVDVKAVAPPKFNIHFIQPKPSDVRATRKADLFVHSGLDHEHWMDPLVEAAGRTELFRGGERNLDMSAGIRILEVSEKQLDRIEGDIHIFGNPHFQMNPENAGIMARTLAVKLTSIDPEHSAVYEKNAADFQAKLDGKLAEWKALAAGLEEKEIISYHKDIAYFAEFMGLKSEHFLEPKPGIPPSPKHLGFLEEYMKSRGIRLVVHPVYYPKGPGETLAARAGGKSVIVCQNPGELPGTEGFFEFFDYNVKTVAEELKK